MSVFDKYPKSYFQSLSDEEKQIKAVFGDEIPMKFRYQKTCGMFDLTYTVENKYIVKFENAKNTRADLKRLVALSAVLRSEKSITFELPDMNGAEFEAEPNRNTFAVWYKKINGRVLDRQDMEMYWSCGKKQQRELDKLMEQIGLFMAQLHSVPVMNIAHLFPESVPARIQRAVHEVLPSIKHEDISFRRKIETAVLRAVYHDYDEVLCHNDLNLWNIARNEDNTIAGVFDFGVANINRPVYEMRYWDYFPEHVDIISETYLKHRGVPLKAPVKERVSIDKQPMAASVLEIYKHLNKQRDI